MSIYQVFDSAREQLARSAASSSSFFTDSVPSDDGEIHKLLNSTSNRDKVLGLRAVLTKIGEGVDCHKFFSDVVKNAYSKETEVREMTTSYLIMYSEHEPELTLMIVNSVQKMLGDPSAVVRMQALRLASALRVPTVAPIVAHLITDNINDVSPLVRIACCQAIGKCYELDSSLGDELLELLQYVLSLPKQLNGDYEVAGWGLATLAAYWPQRIDVMHAFFRKFVPHIREFNEWCQIVVCRMLVRYCRHYIPGPENEDCQLFAQNVVPLLASMNSAVVIEAASALLYVGLPQLFCDVDVAGRLVALDTSQLVWSSILQFCQHKRECFSAYRLQMIQMLTPSVLPETRRLILQCVSLCNDVELTKSELSHLKFCTMAWQSDQESLRAVFDTIAALSGDSTVTATIRWLVQLATNPNHSPELVSESLMCLRILIQQHASAADISATLATLTHLVAAAEHILPAAKAAIVWLLGSHCMANVNLATELLRILLKTLASEATCVRLQTIQLAAKLYTVHRNDPELTDERVPEFFRYAMQLGKFDPDIDVRDRTRLLSALLDREDNSLAILLLQAMPPVPTSFETAGKSEFMIDTAAAYFNKRLNTFSELEDWTTDNSSAELRNVSPQTEQDQQTDSDPTKSGLSSTVSLSSKIDSSNPRAASSSRRPMTFQEFLEASRDAEQNNSEELSTGDETSGSGEDEEDEESGEDEEDEEDEEVESGTDHERKK